MEYAIIRTGGKQYKVSKGAVIEVERLNFKPGDNFPIDDVLLHITDKTSKLGKPKITNVKVLATVLEHIKGEKIRVSKFKAKSRYRRVMGHRQYLTKIKISEITMGKK